VVRTLKIMAVCFLCDATQGNQQGIIRGLGKLNHASFALLVAFYFISLPLGCYFAFYRDLGLKGLWTGQIIGVAVLAAFYSYLICYNFDWEQIAEESIERH